MKSPFTSIKESNMNQLLLVFLARPIDEAIFLRGQSLVSAYQLLRNETRAGA